MDEFQDILLSEPYKIYKHILVVLKWLPMIFVEWNHDSERHSEMCLQSGAPRIITRRDETRRDETRSELIATILP